MREHNEFCDEIKRRKENLIQKKKQKKRIITTCISMVVCLSVVAAVPWDLLASPKIGDDENKSSSSAEHIEETENGTTTTGDPLYGVVGDKVEGDATEEATGAPNGSQEGSFDFVPSGQPTSAETKADKTEAVGSNEAFENEGVEGTAKPEAVVTTPSVSETYYETGKLPTVEETHIIETEIAPEIPAEDESYYEYTSTFVEDTRINVETTFDTLIELPDIEFPVETKPTDTEAVTYDIAYIMISDAAGNIIREGEVKNYEAFVIYLKLSEAELLYHVPLAPESLPDTTAPYDTVADEPVVEETYDAVWEEAVDTEIAVEWEWYNYEEGFDTADEIWIEITECYSTDIVEESTVPDETHGFVSDETNISSRERIIFIEISSDNEKWLFSCDRSDYEAIGRNLEQLFELYEVNGNEQAPAPAPTQPTQPTHTECDHCGEVGVEHERWFIAVVMSNGMIMPEGQGCFESVSAMDAGIWLHYSSVDGDEERRLQEGDLIRVTYNGMIMESYPVQINASKVEIIE